MSCQSYRHELSRCLDGRLASSARARVMDHVGACSGCARFWNELKAAQELALNLPLARTSGDFRDDVWQRIQAGEGAPDHIMEEPVPAMTKMRYGLIGAAAAAVFILAVHFGFGGEGNPIPDEPGPVARIDPPIRGNQPEIDPNVIPTIPTGPTGPAINVLNPQSLAVQTADQVQSAARSLNRRSRYITRIEQLEPRMLPELRTQIRRLHNGVKLLEHLRNKGWVKVDNAKARDCLTHARTLLQFEDDLDKPERLLRTLRALSNCSLDRLGSQIMFTRPSHDVEPNDFGQWIWRRLKAEPDVFKELEFGIVLGPDGVQIIQFQCRSLRIETRTQNGKKTIEVRKLRPR